jgi:hypothetical protein
LSIWLAISPKGVKQLILSPTSFSQAPTVGPAHLAPVFSLCNHFGWDSQKRSAARCFGPVETIQKLGDMPH